VPNALKGQGRTHLLRDTVARLILIEEAIEDGDTCRAFTVARELELDLRSVIANRESA